MLRNVVRLGERATVQEMSQQHAELESRLAAVEGWQKALEHRNTDRGSGVGERFALRFSLPSVRLIAFALQASPFGLSWGFLACGLF